VVVITPGGALTAARSMEHTFMMVLDHVGDQEAMVYAQLGQQPLACTTETALEPRLGTLSCLSARPPDLAFWTGTRPRVVGVSPSIVPFLYSKRTAAARSPDSRYGRLNVLSPYEPTSRRGTSQPNRRTVHSVHRVRE
jgi:hypothetical protein